MKTLNQFINLFWTIAAFSVIIIHWYYNWEVWWFVTSLLFSFLTLIIPLKYFNLSSNPRNYERYGVRIVGMLVQDGGIINKLKKNSGAKYKFLNSSNFSKLKSNTVVYERFHLICLFFFVFSTIHAILCKEYVLAGLIVLSNVVYNLYPIILQQYYRLRIRKLEDRVNLLMSI